VVCDTLAVHVHIVHVVRRAEFLGRNGILRLARASAALFVACVGLVGLSGAVSPAGATNPPGTIKVTVVGAPVPFWMKWTES